MARQVITLDCKIFCNNRKADQEAETSSSLKSRHRRCTIIYYCKAERLGEKVGGKEIAGAPAHVRAGVFRPLYAAPVGGHYSKQLRGENNTQKRLRPAGLPRYVFSAPQWTISGL